MIFFQHLDRVIAVIELLFKTKAKGLYITVAVKSCYLLTKAALKNTILKSDNGLVVSLELSSISLSMPVM